MFCKRCILDNHGIYAYRTNTKRITDPCCTLCINIPEFHKPILFQFRLLSGVFIDTALKMARQRIENIAEIRDYIKAH